MKHDRLVTDYLLVPAVVQTPRPTSLPAVTTRVTDVAVFTTTGFVVRNNADQPHANRLTVRITSGLGQQHLSIERFERTQAAPVRNFVCHGTLESKNRSTRSCIED